MKLSIAALSFLLFCGINAKTPLQKEPRKFILIEYMGLLNRLKKITDQTPKWIWGLARDLVI